MDNSRDDIGFAELLSTVLDAKWTIAGVMGLAVLAGILYVFSAQLGYRADALLQVEDKGQSAPVLGEISGLIGQETAVSAEMEILKSRMVLGKAIDNLKLDIAIRPRYFPVLGAAMARLHAEEDQPVEPWFNLDEYAWGGERLQVETFDVPTVHLGKAFSLVAGEDGRFDLLDATETWLAEGRVGEALDIPLLSGGLIHCFVSELRARPGTRFELTSNHRLETINALTESLEVKERGKQSNVLQIGLEGSDPVRISTIVNEILNIYLRQNVERKSAEAEKTLGFLEKQLPIIRDQMENAEALLNSYRLEQGSVDLPKETQVILDKAVKVEAELSRLRRERQELSRKFTAQHPRMSALEAQAAVLQVEREKLEEMVQALPDKQQEILRLSRDVKVNSELYMFLMNRAQELKVVKAGTVGNVRIVDYAIAPYKPVKPRKPLALALAVVFGFFLGVVMVVMRKSLRAGIEDPDLVERSLGLPIYALVPHSRDYRKYIKQARRLGVKHSLLAELNAEDLAVESLRSLRSSLHFALIEAQSRVILITGPSPGVGKTFVSSNLAAVLASVGKRVILVDADMRRGCVHEFTGITREPGLSEYIAGSQDLERSMHGTEVTGLDVIPTGVIPPNPSELLLHERFSSLLEKLSERYDYVILDSPPVLAVTDAAIVGRLSGAALMVIKSGVHSMREIEQGVKRFTQAGVALKGFVFNDVKNLSSGYGYRKNYVYAYSYAKKT